MTSLYYGFQRNRAELLFNKYIQKKTLKVSTFREKNRTKFTDNESRSAILYTKSLPTVDIFRKLKDIYTGSYVSLCNVNLTATLSLGSNVAVEASALGAKTVYFTYKKDSFCPSNASSNVIQHYVNCEKLFDRLLWLHDEAANRPRPDIEDYYRNELVKVCDFNTFVKKYKN
jgi:hypothetical protein